MREVVYKVWDSLPSKAIGGAGWLGTLFAATKPEKASDWLDWLMTTEQIQSFSLFGFAAFSAYWIVWYLLKPKDMSQESGSITQSRATHGTNSPSIAAHNSTVHNYFAPSPLTPATTQERKKLDGGYNLDALVRGMPPILHEVEEANRPTQSKPLPDMPLTGLLARVYKRLGGAPDDGRLKTAFYKKVDRNIADAVVLGQLHTWGYYMDTPIRPIGHHAWQNATFDHKKNTLSMPGDSVRPMVLRDLRFNKEEADAIWPPK